MTDFKPRNKPYNYNTKYGRRKAREQAAWNYENGDQKYRDSIDEIGCIVWPIVIAFGIGIFILASLAKK